jgi:hypothetical protein
MEFPRMIRKPYLPILLPIFLLLAQQGAVVHELGHVADDVYRVERRNQQPGPQHTPGTTCEKCVVFAHLSGAVTPHILGIDLLPLAHALSGRVAIGRRSADTPAARSRGPPFLL